MRKLTTYLKTKTKERIQEINKKYLTQFKRKFFATKNLYKIKDIMSIFKVNLEP